MGMEARFDLSQLQVWVKLLQTSEDIVISELYIAAVKAMDAYKQAVIGFSPSNFGKLRQTYQYDLTTTANSIKGELYSPLVYALPMERGREPGKYPPIQPLALWALRKGLDNVTRDNVLHVAFLIARAIAEGRSRHQLAKGSQMFAKGYEAAKPKVDAYMDTVQDNIIRKLKG